MFRIVCERDAVLRKARNSQGKFPYGNVTGSRTVWISGNSGLLLPVKQLLLTKHVCLFWFINPRLFVSLTFEAAS